MEKTKVIKPRFFTAYNPQKIVPQSCHQKFVKQYKEVAPFSINSETGEVLNKTNKPKLVRVNDFNMYDYIQSFRDEADIKTILKKFSQTGDVGLLNKSVGSFSDIVNIPDNIHDFNRVNADLGKKLAKFSPKLKDAIINNRNTELSALIQEEIKKLYVARGGKLEDLISNKTESSTKEVKE